MIYSALVVQTNSLISEKKTQNVWIKIEVNDPAMLRVTNIIWSRVVFDNVSCSCKRLIDVATESDEYEL